MKNNPSLPDSPSSAEKYPMPALTTWEKILGITCVTAFMVAAGLDMKNIWDKSREKQRSSLATGPEERSDPQISKQPISVQFSEVQ